MSMNVKVGGTWKEVAIPSMKIGGVWKNATEGWVKVAGVWRKFYPDIITPTIALAGSLYNTNSGAKTISGVSVDVNDYIVALTCCTGTAGSGSVSDNVFGAYGQAIHAVYGSTRNCAIHGMRATVGTTINVTYTPSGDTGGGLTVVVVKSCSASSNIFFGGKSDDIASAVPSCGLSQAPASNDVVLGIATGQNGPTTPGSGYTTAGSGSWTTPANVVHAQYMNGGASNIVSWTGAVLANCCCAVAVTP